VLADVATWDIMTQDADGSRRPKVSWRIVSERGIEMKAISAITFFVCAALVTGIALGNNGVKGESPAMMVSPHTIVLAKVDAVTVHTNTPFATVEAGTLMLEDAWPIEGPWADDCGHIAARFAICRLGLSPGDEIVLTLTGSYVSGGGFSVQDTVRVK
jgi:hypothetical protein